MGRIWKIFRMSMPFTNIYCFIFTINEFIINYHLSCILITFKRIPTRFVKLIWCCGF